MIRELEDRSNGLELSGVDRFRYRTRYFTDSGIIGSKEFVSRTFQAFKDRFTSKHEKRPRPVKGLNSIYSLNRLGTILTVNTRPETTDPITVEDVHKAVEMLLYEENNHFDNITEKAKQFKETFIEVVFDGVEYVPGDEEQSLLLTHGLIKAEGKNLFVSNPIYKSRFTRTFFREAGAGADIADEYFAADGFLNMEAILSDFEECIIQIGVNAFYTNKKPYEKTGQFLLTAWLYQFVEGGKGDLRHEARSGLGRMDILLTYGGRKYIIETKINRANIDKTIDRAVEQLSGKYLLTEKAGEGYVVVFDVKTKVGELCSPRKHRAGDKDVLSFNIGIGK